MKKYKYTFSRNIEGYDDIEALQKSLIWQNCKKCNIKTLHIEKGYYHEVRCLRCGKEKSIEGPSIIIFISKLILLGLISFGTYNLILWGLR